MLQGKSRELEPGERHVEEWDLLYNLDYWKIVGKGILISRREPGIYKTTKISVSRKMICTLIPVWWSVNLHSLGRVGTNTIIG